MRDVPSSSCALAHQWCRHLRTTCTSLALTIAAGCQKASLPNATTAAPKIAAAEAAPAPDTATAAIAADSDWIRTPAGLYHRSCVHEIPEGAVVKKDSVRRRDGTSYALPVCRFKARSTFRPAVLYGPSNVSTAPVSVPAAPNFVAHVLNARRESGVSPAIGSYSQLDLDVAIAPATDGNAVVIVDKNARVYTRHETRGLSVVAADSIAVGDVLEVWHNGNAGSGTVQWPPNPPVYHAVQIVIRR
jgi:hypothetical protein